jgi:phospholipase/carboxylesterase
MTISADNARCRANRAIDSSSRVIVPALRSAGYDVTYVEFDGMHTVPPDIAVAAVQFMMAT